MKGLDKDLVSDVLCASKIMLEDFKENWDLLDLSLALKLLKCSYMEKQLKGLAEIKEIVESVLDNDLAVRRKYRNLNIDNLSEWLISNKIIETVLENGHEEIVKRTSFMFDFIAKAKKISNSQLEALWNCSQGHHDSLQTAAYQVIIEITPGLNSKMQKFLWDKFITVNPEEYTERFLGTFCEFNLKSFELCHESLEFLYELSLDNSKCKLKEQVCEIFEKLLQVYKEERIVSEYFNRFLVNVKGLESICQSMRVICFILRMKLQQGFKEGLFMRVNEVEGGYVKMIIRTFEVLLESGKKSVYSLNKNLKTRIEFWKFLLSRIHEVDVDEIANLQNVVSKPELGSKASSYFAKALLELIRISFTADINLSILDKLYLCKEFSNITLTNENFEVFLELFLRVNKDQRSIDIKNDLFHSRTSSTLHGIEFLIKCIFQCEDNEIVSKSMRLFIKLNLKISRELLNKREDIWKSLFEVLQFYLTQTPGQVKKSLTLVLQFLDGINKKEENLPDNCSFFFRTVSEEPNKLFANYSGSIYTVRKKIASFYKVHANSILLWLSHSNERLDYLYDDLPLSYIKLPLNFLVEILNKTEEPNPSEFFSKCEDFQENLLGMLPSLEKPSAELAWLVLSKVKLIEKNVNQLKNFEIDLAGVFDTVSLHKLVYNFRIVEVLLKDQSWVDGFKTRLGHEKLLEVYLNTNFHSEDSLVLEYNTAIISILKNFTTNIVENIEKLIIKVFESLIQTALTCIETEESAQIVKNGMEILKSIHLSNQEVYEKTIRSYPIRNFLESAFVKCSCNYFSSASLSFLIHLSEKIPALNPQFLSEILSIRDQALTHTKNKTYWSLLKFYIENCPLNPSLEQEYLSFFDVLKQRPCEISSKDPDLILCGILNVLNTIVRKINIKDSQDLIHLLLHTCLFEIPTEFNRLAPKCKHSITRKEAFNLLKELCIHNPEALKSVLTYLSSQHQDPSWRSPRSADWNYHPRANEKSETGYVGMKNLGAICYMISSLQQLFFVKQFRETLLTVQKKDEPLEENLLYQLQYIYSALNYSDKQSVNPKGLCKAFKDWEGRPVNVYEQMDADEFINMFMDRVETQLKGTQGQDVIKELFTGQLATEIIGQKTCSHRSEVNEAFITLPVQVKNKKNLIESLESFKEGEVLEGSNAYQCDHCEQKVTAIRRVCIKYLPNTLFITLRRFEFDYDTMKRLKLNDYCEFPMEINMENFTQEGIERLELLKEKENSFLAGKEFNKQIPERKYEEDYYRFRLRGIIIHMGSADGGHYYSFIRQGEQWHEFNDTVVRKFDASEIPNEAFGGEEKFSFHSATGVGSGIKSKIRNAYILLYEREKLYHYSKEEECLKPLNISCEGKPQVFCEVKEENEKYWRCRSSFSSEYFDFINELTVKNDEDTFKFVISFFLTVMIRSRDFLKIATCVGAIKNHLKENKNLSEWLLELVGFKFNLKELLMDCPTNEKRRVIVGLVHTSFKIVSIETQELFFKRILSYLDLARKPYSHNFCQFFELIFRVLKHRAAFITNFSVSARLMNYIKKIPQEDQFPEVPFKFEDIYLGYDNFKPEEKAEVTSIVNSNSVVFLINSLHLCISELLPEQINYFFEESTLNNLLSTASSRYGGKVLGRFYSTLCFDNKGFSFKYGQYLVAGIDKTNFDKHKPYMRQLFWILANQDQIVQDRTDYIISRFLKQLLDNKKYPMATESSVDFLIKVSTKIVSIKEWLIKKRGELRWLETILSESNTKTKGKESGGRNSTYRLEALKKILRGTITEKDYEDSEGELPEENLPKGTELEWQDPQSQRWMPCTVVSSEGALIFLKSESENFSRWTENLSDNIRVPANKEPKN